MKTNTPLQEAETQEQIMEYELNSQQCATVALYMYKQWEEAMQPPLFIYKTFPDWLAELEKQRDSL